MDNKTGSFIAQLRKEHNLTQKELAEKINVTDKAISRWETGKGLPEVSLLIPL
ncbi:MAG: helix-turn-helix domain-containing protein, partial [Eubacterium sp.]|nr:helix-turn-helix domain-containing protein [Eubacterium sp.]